jgi:hypothetical protein
MKRSFEKFAARLREIGLYDKIEKMALGAHVSMNELYEGPRTMSTSAARRAVYLWLRDKGKGIKEIARLFDRTPSGIHRMTREKDEA